MNYFMPTRLFAESDCIEKHRDALAALGTSCVIVTEATASKASGALADAQSALKACGIKNFVWDGVTANPPVASCIEAGRLAAQKGAEFVLGIGGGSSLDAAKAVAVFAANPELDESGFYGMAWERDPLPIALVGTTAGTGSEVTKVSVLTDSAARKHSIHDDRLYATVAFGDSRHTHTCPAAVTLSCGVDVIAHATEAYFSHKADEISRAFSVRAIRLAAAPLAAAAAGKELSADERRDLYEASILGGLAINTCGTCFPHNVGYYLTENYGVPHGFACAVFLPAMLELVREFDAAYAEAFYDEIGVDESSFVQLVKSCVPAYDFAMTEAEIDAALPRWHNNGSVNNTRARVDVNTIRATLLSLFVR
ncbi:MAG: iron-containing alcohol dehydrogenase [Atopobiaceae bacterium]|nr:iron-containing alcohol dehydrogenase [Atopobiaceae bacterium]